MTLHLRSDSSSSTTASPTPLRQRNRSLGNRDSCSDALPGYSFVASVCMGRDGTPRGYRIICTKEGPGRAGDTAQFRFIDGQCPPEEVYVDERFGRVRRMHCERPDYTSDSPAKRRKIISNSTLVKKSNTASHDLTSLTGHLGLNNVSPATPEKGSPSSRAIDRCPPPWAFLSSACHDTSEGPSYRAYKVVCSLQYKVRGPMGKKERSSINVLSGTCLPEENCVDRHGHSAMAYCLRQDHLIRLAQSGLDVIAKSSTAEELQGTQKTGTDVHNLAVGSSVAYRKDHAPINQRNSLYKRESGTIIAQCPGQPRWLLVASGCDTANHRKYWAVCSEAVPIWHIPHEIIREGACTEREICMSEAFDGPANRIRGLEHHYHTVAKCSKLVDWAMMGQTVNGAHVPTKRSNAVLAGQQTLLEKRGTANGRVIDICAGEQWDWPVVLSACHERDPKKYYTICSEPLDLWDLPEQIRTEGQCREGEICVNGRITGASVKWLENFERFAAKCIRISEGQGAAMASGDRTPNPRTPSPPFPREPNHRPPTASSTYKNKTQESKERYLPPDSAALKRRHDFAKRIIKWRPINRCPMKYPPADWLLWDVNCDPSSPRNYVMECKQRVKGVGPGHVYGQKIYLKGHCSEDEICVQGRYPTSSKCVSHEAFADLVTGATEGIKDVGKPLKTRQISLANRSRLPGSGDLTGNKNWRPINQCSEARSHWPVVSSNCDSEKGLRDYVFMCLELNAPKGHIPKKFLGSGRCEDSEICVQDEGKGEATCVSHESLVRLAQLFRPRGKFAAGRPAQPQTTLERRAGRRLIDHCVGDIARWAVRSSACDEQDPRTYWIVCISPTTARLRIQTGECAPSEICVPGDENAPQNTKIESQYRNHGMARCVQQEISPDIAQLATQGGKWRNQSLADQFHAAQTQRTPIRSDTTSSQPNPSSQHEAQANQTQPDQSITTPHRPLDKHKVSRPINECPGFQHKGWTPLASNCTGDRERDYTIWCSSPNRFTIISIEGRCSEDEICISGSSGPQSSDNVHAFLFPGHNRRGFAKCMKHEGFIRLAQLATEKSATKKLATNKLGTKGAKAHSGKQKRALESLVDGWPINQCPEDPRFTVWTSTCHPHEPRTYFITCRIPHLANFIHRTGRCSEDEICISGYTGEVRSYPIRPSEYWHYGIAKCVKREKFIAAVEASKGNEGAATNERQRLHSRQNNRRPINECPGAPYRPIVNSVCDPNHPRRYFVTCEKPEISEIYGPEVRGVEQRVGECEKDEVCVSGYNGPPPANVPDAFMHDWHRQYGIAHCVKHESFSRIGELVEKYKKMDLKKSTETATTPETMKKTETIKENESVKKTETATKTRTRKERRSLEERTNWRPIDRCPGHPHVR